MRATKCAIRVSEDERKLVQVQKWNPCFKVRNILGDYFIKLYTIIKIYSTNELNYKTEI